MNGISGAVKVAQRVPMRLVHAERVCCPRRFRTWDFASDRSEAKSDVPLAIRTTRRIAVLEGGSNGRGVDRPTFLTSDGNPEVTPHVLRIPTFSRLVSEGCPRPRMLYRIPETGSGS